MLTDKRDKLEKMARVLLETEKMEEHDIIAILGPRVS
jgi:ATP-dependent Zn protease